MRYAMRSLRLFGGLALVAFGSYMRIQANLGLSPWEAFSMGLSYLTKLSYGKMVVATGLVLALIAFLCKERIGFGTILNAMLVGQFVDMYNLWSLVPQANSLALGIVWILAGQVATSVGSYFYISAAMGCGPRDAIMVATGKRLARIPIGLVKCLIEGTVLLIGYLLGAKVGIGTVVAMISTGVIMQFTFHLFRFDVKKVSHESFLETINHIFKNGK